MEPTVAKILILASLTTLPSLSEGLPLGWPFGDFNLNPFNIFGWIGDSGSAMFEAKKYEKNAAANFFTKELPDLMRGRDALEKQAEERIRLEMKAAGLAQDVRDFHQTIRKNLKAYLDNEQRSSDSFNSNEFNMYLEEIKKVEALLKKSEDEERKIIKGLVENPGQNDADSVVAAMKKEWNWAVKSIKGAKPGNQY